MQKLTEIGWFATIATQDDLLAQSLLLYFSRKASGLAVTTTTTCVR